MRILVVGCGNVGSSLVERLCAEGHNVVVIDQRSNRLKEITERYDVMGVQGNGASYAVQMEAGIEETDLLIAVTNEDELNLFCCLIAKKAGGCHTIARVRNPVYSQEINFIKDELGLSMIINPEQATAAAIARLLKFPSAIEVDTFSKGRVELSRFRLPENCALLQLIYQYFRPSATIFIIGAGSENRTRATRSEAWHSTTKLYPHIYILT